MVPLPGLRDFHVSAAFAGMSLLAKPSSLFVQSTPFWQEISKNQASVVMRG